MHKALTVYLRLDKNSKLIRPSKYISSKRRKNKSHDISWTRTRDKPKRISSKRNKVQSIKKDIGPVNFNLTKKASDPESLEISNSFLRQILQDIKREPAQKVTDHTETFDFIQAFLDNNELNIPGEIRIFNEIANFKDGDKNRLRYISEFNSCENPSLSKKVFRCLNNFFYMICCQPISVSVYELEFGVEQSRNVAIQEPKSIVKSDRELTLEKEKQIIDRDFRMYVVDTYVKYSEFKRIYKLCLKGGDIEFKPELCAADEERAICYKRTKELEEFKLLLDRHRKFKARLSALNMINIENNL